MKVVQHLVFGYDVDSIQQVMIHIYNTYNKDQYKMYIGYGDDVMNSLDVCFDISNDEELMELIDVCEGSGMYKD